MAAKIRLARAGTKKRPFYRIVVTDSRNKRDGRFIELLGTYNPRIKPVEISLKVDRIKHWLANGVQKSDTAARLIREHGLEEKAPAATQE